MNVPRYAWLVRKLLVSGGASIAPLPPAPAERARAIAAVAHAIEMRARRRRTVRWAGAAVFAAAAVAGVFSGRILGNALTHAPSRVAQEIVAHPAAGGASVLVSGAEAPLVEGRSLASGSRIVTPPGGRATLSFSTGTSVALGEDADVTVSDDGGSSVLRLAGGVVDLHVAKLGASQRFVVDTPDAEVEVRGTQFRVGLAAAEPACGGGTTTRVTVTEGVVVVRHAGVESRVAAGEGWPSTCWHTSVAASPSTDAPLVMRPASRPFTTGRSVPVSALAEQNDLFAEAAAAKRRGDVAGAVAAFDRLLDKYPACPLAEGASVERMRLLRGTAPGRAGVLAQQYLARYPRGFARAEAEAIVSGLP
jgi:hypothetical protein